MRQVGWCVALQVQRAVDDEGRVGRNSLSTAAGPPTLALASDGPGRELEQSHAQAWALAAAATTAGGLLECLHAREGHSPAREHAVVGLALAIGRRLSLDDRLLGSLEWAARLHDIGKLGVSPSILNKPSRLTGDDWTEMRKHAEIGERIIASVPEIAHLARIVRAGHERWDGNGYPDGLLGREIPLDSRIVLVSDAYQAMITTAPYRHAPLTPAEARGELERHAGTQFCPTVTAAALAVLAETEAAPSPHPSEGAHAHATS
jgi:HD-GYP domain-containing protein (c-di-GMP phosphodiesterase class II)